MTQEVIRKDVGARVDIGHEDVKKFYDDHQKEFVRPESVYAGEILISTDGKRLPTKSPRSRRKPAIFWLD